MRIPETLHYSAEHLWTKPSTEGLWEAGITDYAQDLLGDIVFIDLPEVGAEFQKGESFGSVESVKAASDVYAPVSGTVVEINQALADEPGIVNKSPEANGWFIKIEMSKSAELKELMDPTAYKAHCEKDAH
jgi:glycine cleavage system H protein